MGTGRQESLPQEEALIWSVNEQLLSKQFCKLMLVESISESTARAIFNNAFVNGVAVYSIITHAKKQLRKSVFTPEKILKQMDLHGGRLHYEGISIID
jgi:hypothetical protein